MIRGRWARDRVSGQPHPPRRRRGLRDEDSRRRHARAEGPSWAGSGTDSAIGPSAALRRRCSGCRRHARHATLSWQRRPWPPDAGRCSLTKRARHPVVALTERSGPWTARAVRLAGPQSEAPGFQVGAVEDREEGRRLEGSGGRDARRSITGRLEERQESKSAPRARQGVSRAAPL